MNPVIPSPYTIQPSALARLSLRDKLLLAQAVHEIGTSPPDWGRVSALLLSHPLIRQQSRLEQANVAGLTLGRIFGTRECERAWTALMRQRGLVLGKDELPPEPAPTTPTTPTTPKPKEPRGLQPRTDRRSQLALAQLLYAERMEELKEQIREKEEQFKSLVKEIDEIKSGKADARLEMELRMEMENLANGPPLPPSTPGSAGQSVVMTPGSNASTTPKSAKGKGGRVRGESLVGTPDSAKKVTVAMGAGVGKKGERRGSLDDTPSKVPVGAAPALPSAPSISLPLPNKSLATAPDASTADRGEMTTEEAEQAVATAATEAAVKALQDDKAATSALQTEVDKVAEKVVETETNLELSAQAEGDANATGTQQPTVTTTTAVEEATPAKPTQEEAVEKTKENEAPPADVVVKDQTDKPAEEAKVVEKPAATTPATSPPAPAAAAGAGGEAKAASSTDTAASAPASASASTGKRKRDDEEQQVQSSTAPSSTTAASAEPKATASSETGSPIKKARTADPTRKVPSSEGDMDSEDEAEAAVGVDSPAPVPTAAEAKKPDAEATEATPAAAESAKPSTSETKEPEKKMEVDSDSSSSSSSPSSSSSSSSSSDEEEDQVKSLPCRKPSPTPPQASHSTPLRRPSSRSTKPDPTPTPTPTPAASEREKAAKRKQTQVLLMLLTEVSNHTHGNLFHAPIKEADAPDYYTLIRQPLDIKTIKAKIKEGSIGTAKQLQRALNLMFANSLMYNRPGTEVFRMANEMRGACEDIFRRYEGTQRF
ncbi:hypothetical protein NDA11_007031 [Ustilago hordei]|nr:hypothetical protein NDA11_007031 [Ustilago hordei]KAJ1601061.1 hypothetical protein NDA14_006610 [Ustilago hordei]UTT92988.1 hypothetical protein NDA17_000153 [Ustilago hordei]